MMNTTAYPSDRDGDFLSGASSVEGTSFPIYESGAVGDRKSGGPPPHDDEWNDVFLDVLP